MESLEINLQPGETIAILGSKGTGKSTLAKEIGGKKRGSFPNKSIYINHILINFKNRHEAKKNGFYYIEGIKNLAPNLSVVENVYLENEITGPLGQINWNKLYSSTKSLLKQLNIPTEIIEKRIESLTHAEQIFVGIAKAVTMKMKFLIFDEISKDLTEKENQLLIKILKSLKLNKICSIYVPYHLTEIINLADQYLVLEGGLIEKEPTKFSEKMFDEILEMMTGRKKIEKMITEASLEKFGITNREKEIIKLISHGCSNHEISDNLKISLGTVKNHIYNIFQKTNVKNRTELIKIINL